MYFIHLCHGASLSEIQDEMARRLKLSNMSVRVVEAVWVKPSKEDKESCPTYNRVSMVVPDLEEEIEMVIVGWLIGQLVD